MDRAKCLLCYEYLEDDRLLYHPLCSKKFFGKAEPPVIPYKLNELEKLAKKVIRSHITVPGVQAKLSLNLERRGKQVNYLTLVGLWGNYILKPPVARFPQMPEIEDLTMHLASFFKIGTVPHGLIPLQSGELAYITKRIDRIPDGIKLPMEDMCQLTGRLTEDKYKGSMEQVARAITKHSSNSLFDVIRFFEMAVFSFLTGNADMHLKNFSLICTPDEQMQLTPACDMLSTRLLIPESADAEEMALTLNGKKSNFKYADFEKFSGAIGLNQKQLENSFKRFKQNLPYALKFIEKGMLSEKTSEEFRDLIQERAVRLHLY
jgi:serine/threonine-protein kinase HipA